MDGQRTTREDDALRNPTLIYSAMSPQQAHLLKNLLADMGITATVTNEVLTGGSGVDLVGLPTATKVLVAEEDAQAARRFAVEFDERSALATEETEPPAHEAPAHEAPVWPRCPECDARRSTRCPVCQTAGTDFAEADRDFLGSLGLPDSLDPSGQAQQPAPISCDCSSPQCGGREKLPSEISDAAEPAAQAVPGTSAGAASQPRLALMCSTCDEPFVPEFPRRCEWCGHEFPDGYSVEALTQREPIPMRAIVVVCALAGLMLLGMLYFIWIV